MDVYMYICMCGCKGYHAQIAVPDCKKGTRTKRERLYGRPHIGRHEKLVRWKWKMVGNKGEKRDRIGLLLGAHATNSWHVVAPKCDMFIGASGGANGGITARKTNGCKNYDNNNNNTKHFWDNSSPPARSCLHFIDFGRTNPHPPHTAFY